MRRKKKTRQWLFWILAVVLTVLTLAWFALRGDIHSDRWVRAFFDPNE